MIVFEAVLVLLVACVVLSALARRLGVPYPAFLALAGASLAFAPIASPFRLDPALALALFVAPVLLDAAYDTSLRDLKKNWAPVGSLVLVAVGLTTLAIAWVAKTLVPGLPWA
ncbi:MAG: cation:proton antiporter, partial [Caulobacteraceae bacterium]